MGTFFSGKGFPEAKASFHTRLARRLPPVRHTKLAYCRVTLRCKCCLYSWHEAFCRMVGVAGEGENTLCRAGLPPTLNSSVDTPLGVACLLYVQQRLPGRVALLHHQP